MGTLPGTRVRGKPEVVARSGHEPTATGSGPARLSETMQTDPGGTANLAVLGGNLPPSVGTASAPTNECIPGAPGAAGW